MQHKNTLDAARTALVIVDMQEAFRNSIPDFAELAAHLALVAHAAQVLNIPILVTEQYPKGLGRTANEIRAVLPNALAVVEKTSFSACGAPEFNAQLEKTGARDVLVCGIEAHICVNQTVHDLLARGFQVHYLVDGIASRHTHNKAAAFDKMQHSGALPSTTEMALFELMRDARHEQFKSIQKLIK
ncbi:MAG: isochorismatase family protein [Pyrinomonadaceae bacterium]